MNLCTISNKSIKLFTILYIVIVAILVCVTPFTQPEANILYSKSSNISTFVAQYFNNIFHNSCFIRLPFFTISLLNIFLFKEVIKIYIDNNIYANLALFIFLITPGLFVSSILVNYASFAIFITLLFIYSYYKKYRLLQVTSIVLLLFTNIASFVFYIAIAIFTYRKKDWFLFFISIVLLILSAIIDSYPIHGVPRGHLLQVLAVYGVTLSPFYFFAVVYAIYRLAIDRKKTLLWYIVTSFFISSLILSFRQLIKITDFTPFVVISSILVVMVYQNSISVRLKIFQTSYKRVCSSILIVLLLETSIIAFNYPLYLLLGQNFKIMDTSIYTIAKISNNKCINSINSRDKALYKYYGIKKCN